MTLPGFRLMLQGIVVISLLTTTLHAQYATTALSGRVLDPDGLGVPQAEISVVNKARAVHRQAMTGSDGLFFLEQLEPLNYSVSVEKAGFAPVRYENVALNV